MPACEPGASRGLWACRGPGLFQTFKEPEAGQGGQRAPQSLQPEPFQARNPKPARQGPSAVAMARCWVTSKAAWCSRALHGNGSVLAFCEAALLDRVVIPSKLSTGLSAVATRCWVTSEAAWGSQALMAFCAVVSGYFRSCLSSQFGLGAAGVETRIGP